MARRRGRGGRHQRHRRQQGSEGGEEGDGNWQQQLEMGNNGLVNTGWEKPPSVVHPPSVYAAEARSQPQRERQVPLDRLLTTKLKA
jgi:hypothetical protein